VKLQKAALYLLSIIILISTVTASAAVSVKPSIAILDLNLGNVSDDSGRIIRNKIEYSFYQSGKFNILERSRFDILKKEDRLLNKNIASKEYAIEAGRILPAEYVIIGSITFSDRYFIHLNLVDVKSGTIVYSFNRDFESENMIYDAAEVIKRGVEDEIFSSLPVKKESNGDKNLYYLSVHSGYIPPLRKAEFSNGGFLIDAEFGLTDIFSSGINAGLSADYIHFYTDGATNYISMIPLMVTSSYTFRFSQFGILPGLGVGTIFITIDKDNGSHSAFEPCAFLFIKGDVYVTKNIAVELSANYYTIYEPAGIIDFFSFSAGITTYL